MSSPLNTALKKHKVLHLTSFQKDLIMGCFVYEGVSDKVAMVVIQHERFDQHLVEAVTAKRRDTTTVQVAAEYLLAQCYERGILERPKPTAWQRICAFFRKETPAQTAPEEPPLGTPKKAS